MGLLLRFEEVGRIGINKRRDSAFLAGRLICKGIT